MVSSWRSATLLARWRILICCAMAPLECRQPSPRSVLRELVIRTPSIHSVACSMLDGAQVRLYSRPGNDLTRRFPLIVETLARLRSRSCIIDGEAVACDDNGVASFDLVRHHRANESIFLYAFDLIELNGDDLRRDPLEVRKATLRSMLAKAGLGLRFNEHFEGDG